jgi:hypothetical protein
VEGLRQHPHRDDRGRNVANQYGWKIGQKIPIRSNIYPQKNGSKAWAFDLVGIYDGKRRDWQKQTNTVFISHDYFDEANQFSSGRTNFFMLKLADGNRRRRSRRRSTRCSRTRRTKPRRRPRKTSTSDSPSRSATSA